MDATPNAICSWVVMRRFPTDHLRRKAAVGDCRQFAAGWAKPILSIWILTDTVNHRVSRWDCAKRCGALGVLQVGSQRKP